MANNERKPGESIKQYLDRIKAQKREQRIQEEIDKVKSKEDYGGELEAAIVTAEKPQTMEQKFDKFVVKLPEMFRAKWYNPSKFTFTNAYKDARSSGQKTFFYGTKYFNTDYKGVHGKQYEQDLKSGKVAWWEKQYPNFTYPELRKEKEEELATYGITDEQTQNKTTKSRLLKKIPARGYNVNDAISAIIGEHTSFNQYDSPEEALQAIHKKYGNKFLDAPVDILRSGFDRDWSLHINTGDWKYEDHLPEKDKKLYKSFKNDIDAYNNISIQNKELHRGEYDLLLGYPVSKDASIKPVISKYKTGTLPYYYTTSLLEDSRPFVPSYMNDKIEERRIQEQKWETQLDSLYSLYPKLPDNLTWEQRREARENDPVVQNLQSQIDSILDLRMKPYDKLEDDIYRNSNLKEYWKDRGLTFWQGDPHLDQSTFIRNASKNDVDFLSKTGLITGLNNTWFEDVVPGNHLANTGNEDYYHYSKENPVSDYYQGKYDDIIKKILYWAEKLRGNNVGGVNNVSAINTESFGINSEPSLGTYTLSVPADKSFTSVYDKFDIDPFGLGNDKPIITVGKPFEYYTRFYPEGKTPNIDSLYVDFDKKWPK